MNSKGTPICDREPVMVEITENFLLPKPKKRVWGNFRIEDGKIIYRSTPTTKWDSESRSYKPVENSDTDVIAIKTQNGTVLGNASILPLIGRYFSYGNESRNTTQTKIQTVMENSEDFDLVPFGMFEEMDLDIETYTMINGGGAETIKRERPNPKYNRNQYREMEEKGIPETVIMDSHFMGSKLFSVNGFGQKKEGAIKFLFDIDRNEIKHGIFNPFVVQPPENGTPIKTVEDAYASLIPLEVKTAMETGKDVKRQGEWYFIPADKSPEEKKDYTEAEKRDFGLALGIQKLNENGWNDNSYSDAKKLLGNEEFDRLRNLVVPTENPIRFELRAGKNRPNHAEFGLQKDGVSYVKGEISHSGREHKTITLNDWHIAMPNTAIGSFTITGDVD